MTDIIFSFDTEDFTSSVAADAVIEEAKLLKKHGIKGGFSVVGLLAQQLQNWGRQDVIEAMKEHIIGNHSYGHSLHPTINEYTDLDDFDAAYEEVLRQETLSQNLIENMAGRKPLAFACPPGNQKSYVAMYAYADMGYPIYADTVCDTPDGRGMYYCNIFHSQYTYCMERFFYMKSEERLKEVLEELATHKRVIAYTHPNMALFSDWWDKNYEKYNHCEFGQWEPCQRRPLEETQRYYRYLDRFMELVKEDPRFHISNYEELAAKLKAEGQRVINRAEVPMLAKALQDKWHPVLQPKSLSIADVFLAARDFLLGEETHQCDKVYGFLEDPMAIDQNVTLTAKELRESAEAMDVSRFLPEAIRVGDQLIGPGDWLRAALQVLQGADVVTLQPGPQLPSLDEVPMIRDCYFKGEWMQSDEFEDRYLSKRLRLQSWTMRFVNF